ncbi:thioredoxin [Chryseobacterium sp. 6424]|uniref:peroxiredoxin family protein n=1 Tax=Chryseobacterium sp. 6424 TaxID=2039166 RepID=UPI000EFB958A|nr:TlpA disulfide reductase family protein [Chryseobacterium sp. 6424]AYO58330.1 thioredoxin [Chryseobacterium sp. 6424]
MKRFLVIISILVVNTVSSQFKINVEAPASFSPKEVYLYTLHGSKDILNAKEIRKGNVWQINVTKPYIGMLKLYFPEGNTSINLISENKDVRLKFDTENGKITHVQYLDESNALMNALQDAQQKKEYILPALHQIKDYYTANSEFRQALDREINRLSAATTDISKYPFVQFYHTNYAQYVEKNPAKKLTHDEMASFLNKSNEMLETSSLLRPVLISYLNAGDNANLIADVDKLLKVVNIETPRGQTILSELIEIFDAYGMKDLKNRYLTEAKNLKCTVNDRLARTIATNSNTEIGAVLENYVFNQPSNTTAKSIHQVKADKKVIVFWTSTCSHCEADVPKLIEKYRAMKSKNIEIIALSLDTDKIAYDNKAKTLPWINDTELKGWYSSFAEKYNVVATPTYFVLDANNKIIAKPDHAADVISYLNLN